VTSGATFFIKDRSIDSHLWVIISDPLKDPTQVVMVSITTYESRKESACILDAGDHPGISHKSETIAGLPGYPGMHSCFL